MKKVLLGFLILIILTMTGCVTMGGEKASPELLTVSEVVEFSGVSKDTLFMKANSWMVDAFNSAESVIQYTDKDAGIIKGKYLQVLPIGMGDKMNVTSTITIEVKDEKTKITFGDAYYKITIRVGTASSTSEGDVEDLKTITKVREEWIALLNSFKSSMKTKSTDW